MSWRNLFLLFILSVGISSCGQKGALVLPNTTTDNVTQNQ